MKNNSQPETQVSESLIREVITSYNKLKGEYKLNTFIYMTPDEIIQQIAKDLNDTNK